MGEDPHRPVSVVVPAHNEASGIARVLRALGSGDANDVELIVVSNGSMDDTVQQARSVGPGVIVLEVEEASKRKALEVGDARAQFQCRAWVDADVTIQLADLQMLVKALTGEVKAVAPCRRLDLSQSSWLVRGYYAVWEQLPQVKGGVFGRGVIVMSPDGHRRVASMPHVMSDDLLVSEAFSPSERLVVPNAEVMIAAPRTIRDLVRRRIRVATGNAQLDSMSIRTAEARTRPSVLVRIALSGPSMPAKALVFALITIVARLGARRQVARGDFTTWLRDESSRRH
jgi:glycosyltransferase involved in cell wall biosynthesis